MAVLSFNSRAMPLETTGKAGCADVALHRAKALDFMTLMRRLLALPSRWRERVRDRRHLRGLDDHVLGDIGITRAEVNREALQPFWCEMRLRRRGW